MTHALVLMAALAAEPAPHHDTAAQPMEAVALTAPAPAGAGKASKVVYQREGLTLVLITLKPGGTLPDHASQAFVTIQALKGTGVVKMGETSVPLSAKSLVALEPGALHAVVATGKGELVLLVSHAGAHGHAEGK